MKKKKKDEKKIEKTDSPNGPSDTSVPDLLNSSDSPDGSSDTDSPNGSEKILNKNQIKKENKILQNFFIWIGIFVVLLGLWLLILYSQANFTYQGLKFNKMKQGNLILYHTKIPVFYQGKNYNYNLYLRKNPKKSKVNFDKVSMLPNGTLEKAPSQGKINLREMMVLNISNEFQCKGDGVVSVANLQQSLKYLGTKVIHDPNATCDDLGRYLFVKVLAGNRTRIEQTSPTCYNLYVNNCEVLDVTEKFLVESIVEHLKDTK